MGTTNGVVCYPDRRLVRAALPVQPEAFGTHMLQAEADRMLREAERLKAAGLAHCQIGGALALVVVPRYDQTAPGEPRRAQHHCVANAELLELGPMCRAEEACLSLARVLTYAEAPMWARVRFTTMDGETLEEIVEGYAARVWWHEIKHTQGELLSERVRPPWRKLFLKQVQKKTTGGPA